MKFSKGDRVKCIEARPTQWVKLGEEYTIKDILPGKGENFLVLEEIYSEYGSHNYNENRFELIQSHYNIF